MSTRLKLMPVLIMLLAGAATSVITFVLQYETKKALWLIVGVLVLFYILGAILQRIRKHFEDQIAEEEAKKAEEEGKVVEKEGNSAETEGNGESDNPSPEADVNIQTEEAGE